MNTIALLDVFDQIVLSSCELSKSLIQSQRDCWVPISGAENYESELQKATRYYQDFWYVDGQDGRETRSCFGLVSARLDQVKLAKQINTYKNTFKVLVGELKKFDGHSWLELKSKLNMRHSEIHKQLHFSGLSRLHLKQTWRTIPVLDRRPVRAGLNWYTSGRSIKKISVLEAQAALEQMDTSSPHILVQLKQLGNLSPSTPLAKVQTQAPVMRANLIFDDSLGPNRLAMNVSLPILFLDLNDDGLPIHNLPDFDAPLERRRAVRSDRRIEDEPFLASIRVHLYSN